MTKKVISSLLAVLFLLLIFLGTNLLKDDSESEIMGSVPAGDEVEFKSDLQFRSQDRFEEHFEKHVIKQQEFGDISKEEYLRLAQELMDNPSEDVLTKQDGEDTLYYDPQTNSFGVKSGDGYIRTFFKPSDGIQYFERQ